MSNGYNGWGRPLHVTLTATSNPYLADRLPLAGRIQVLEATTDDYAQPRCMIFSEDKPDGIRGAFVAVDDAQFTYTGRPAPDRPRCAGCGVEEAPEDKDWATDNIDGGRYCPTCRKLENED